MQVEFVDARGRAVSASIDGEVLGWPGSLDAERPTKDRIVMRPRGAAILGSADAPDVVVGDVPLLTWSPRLGIKVEVLRVPPPQPFDLASIQTMVDEVLQSPVPRPSSIVDQGRFKAYGRRERRLGALEFEAVAEVAALSERLIAAWPERESRLAEWRPVEVRGGREDAAMTERYGSRKTMAVRQNDRWFPERTARVVASLERWQSRTLANQSRALSSLLKASFPDSPDLVWSRLDTVAALANPPALTPDPAPSNWPALPRRLLAAILRAQSVGIAQALGDQHLPATRLWSLYELWVGVICHRAITDELGEPSAETISEADGSGAWLARWDTDKGRHVTLALQYTVGKACHDDAGPALSSVYSLSSDLRPDVLIGVVDQDDIRLSAIDAKLRTGTKFIASDLAEAASKYLWGIRIGDQRQVALERTIIATCIEPEGMHSEHSRIVGVRALPGVTENLRDQVRSLVR